MHLQANGQAMALLPQRAQHARLVRARADLHTRPNPTRLTRHNKRLPAQGARCVNLTVVVSGRAARTESAAPSCKQLPQPGSVPGAELPPSQAQPSEVKQS